MKKITMQQFLVRQPGYPKESPTDAEFLNIANTLVAVAERIGMSEILPEGLIHRMALTVVGYFQDVLTDSGVWRTMVDECRRLYGCNVPFYETDDNYILYELNEVDVRFLIWYVMAMCGEERLVDPERRDIRNLSAAWHEVLESIYEDVPEPESYHFARELELTGDDVNPDEIYKLGHWLFMHCYLLTPAYALTLSGLLRDPELVSHPQDYKLLQNKLEQSMIQDPTGPLALYINEWLYLIIEGKLPKHLGNKAKEANREHPYYSKFMAATGGSPIKFIGSYRDLNRFCIDALGWDAGEEHLPQMKNERNFTLLVNRTKGMLLAKNINECIKHPENPYYDREYARKHAIELLTVRGCCPADLLKYLYDNECIVDASFEGSDNVGLVKKNHDFIARCFLQQYYRGD